MLDSSGTLRIRAYTAGGALPVADAIVTIMGAEERNRDVAYSLLTDMDGQTDIVVLPAPALSYSLAPNPKEAPSAIYNIEINREGYLKKRVLGVPVFSGVNSVQLINMIPDAGNRPSEIPRGSENSIVPENNL